MSIKYMAGIIISSCLAALVLAGLIFFIYKTRSKTADNVKQIKENDKTVATEKEQSKDKKIMQELVESFKGKSKEEQKNWIELLDTAVELKKLKKEDVSTIQDLNTLKDALLKESNPYL